MKILTFGASSHKNSINKQLAYWAAKQIENEEITYIDLNDFEMPIYSIDKEMEQGIPNEATVFANHIDQNDLILISFAEHNGAYTAAFKNCFDWISRIPNRTVWNNKKMLLLATSPGERGGSSVLQMAVARFPFNGGNIVGSFSLPKFHENFNQEKGITNETLLAQFNDVIKGIS